MLKRQLSSSSDDSLYKSPKSPTKKPRQLFTGLKIHITNVKLSPEEFSDLVDIAESKGAQVVADAGPADVIITRISMRQRLERHIPWDVAQDKVVLTPEWLIKSAEENTRLDCDDFLAVSALKPHPWNPVKQLGSTSQPDSPMDPRAGQDDIDSFEASKLPRYCVERRTPLVCPNQELVKQLAVIRRARELESEERSSLSYSRAIASIKAYPTHINSVEEVSKLPFVGPKTSLKISQYLASGMIKETQEILNDNYYTTLSMFETIYGIGPSTARDLYSKGLRTFKDLEEYYTEQFLASKDKEKLQGILYSLALSDDLSIKIDRAEVEEITRTVAEELKSFYPGCIYTIAGGYRRGKRESNDVDIIFTHETRGREAGVLENLIRRLRHRGLITHVLPATSFRTAGSMRSYSNQEAVERILTIFKLPQDSPSFPNNPNDKPRIHRRLDLLFAPIEVYWCTVVGWTGSIMFERDLRLWCKEQKGLKFDSSGLTRRRDMARIRVNSEEHLFELIGLPYVEPIFRNCDF